MANKKLKVPENISGNFFVDKSCIDCDTCRKFAPKNFKSAADWSYVGKQPVDESEIKQCLQALLSCPVGAIGTEEKSELKEAFGSFPIELAPDIFLLGFNSKDSYGADSYFIKCKEGNWMVDSPRFTPHLVKKIEAMGGLSTIFLTHRDDVADSHLYAKKFKAKRIIHQKDLVAAKDAEIVLKGDDDFFFSQQQARIIFTPGHTEGHSILLWKDQYLFTGDHFAWLESKNRFGMFEDACWFDFNIQKKSLRKMRELKNVQWVFPGHGRRAEVAPGDFPHIIDDLLQIYHQ